MTPLTLDLFNMPRTASARDGWERLAKLALYVYEIESAETFVEDAKNARIHGGLVSSAIIPMFTNYDIVKYYDRYHMSFGWFIKHIHGRDSLTCRLRFQIRHCMPLDDDTARLFCTLFLPWLDNWYYSQAMHIEGKLQRKARHAQKG